MELSFGRYLIRSWHAGDVSSLAKYANNRKVSINLRDSFPYPYRKVDAEAWIEAATNLRPQTHFAIATEQEAIGGIGLVLQSDVYYRSAELGYWLAEPYWGKGITTAAVLTFTDFCFQHYDLIRIYAGVFDRNVASARVLEKAAFQLEGRLRRRIVKEGIVLDELMYARIRDDYR